MNSSNYCASIGARTTEEIFFYQDEAVLKLYMIYPVMLLRRSLFAEDPINRQIQRQVNDYYNYVSTDLYQQAISSYNYALDNGFPFHRFEAVLQYQIAYNMNCHLSMYRDQYEYTGGAHGSTIRRSDTWNLTNDTLVPLSSFFSSEANYQALLIERILEQANTQLQKNPGIYFENYRELIVQYFNEDNYYLTPEGVAIYYQQYEIAPYSTGIVVFNLPYTSVGWYPSCKI